MFNYCRSCGKPTLVYYCISCAESLVSQWAQYGSIEVIFLEKWEEEDANPEG